MFTTAAPIPKSSKGSLFSSAVVASGPAYGSLEGVSPLPDPTRPAGLVIESEREGPGSSGWSGSGFDLDDPVSELDDPSALKYGVQDVLLVDTSPAQYGKSAVH